jgi:hypothetical protein
MVVAEPFAPWRGERSEPLSNARPYLKLDAMALSVIEPDGLHAAKALKRPGKTHGRILAA